jgi:hypothetical protein
MEAAGDSNPTADPATAFLNGERYSADAEAARDAQETVTSTSSRSRG